MCVDFRIVDLSFGLVILRFIFGFFLDLILGKFNFRKFFNFVVMIFVVIKKIYLIYCFVGCIVIKV